MTPGEKALWKELRYRQVEGRKFLRQHPIIYDVNKAECFFYIPDFYCAGIKLAIELDGEIHRFQAEKDRKRDMVLQSMGITVIRIRNEELANMECVIRKIRMGIRRVTV